DTRASGEEIEAGLCGGLCTNGIHVMLLGVVPTPAVSQVVRDLQADLGVAITASHNPATDNGIKLFDNRGLKFSVEAEAEIEGFIAEQTSKPEDANIFTCGYPYDGQGVYINTLKSQLHQHCIRDWKIVLDTANGATAETSPAVLRHFGAELVSIGDSPDGTNINAGVGSEHPDRLAEAVRREKARLGIAHDGDGDRLVVCDETGSVVDGDQLLGILALAALREGTLVHNTLVATVQSNFGLDKTLSKAGGRVERVAVGDRNVLLRMRALGCNLGGENSGHIIQRDISVAGDGLLAAVRLIAVMLRTGKPLSALRQEVELFPQATKNLRVAEKIPLEECPALSEAMKRLDEEFGQEGRQLVRYSGTEPKLRLLVEAADEASSQKGLELLIEAAKTDLEVID
ncbi:MAG: phosphoglucosamine mutase, partial [Puniceicoccales bacterium]